MALPDWITVPRRQEESAWPNFVARWNAYMRELQIQFASTETDLSALETLVNSQGVYTDYTPTLFNHTATVNFARRALVGDQVHYYGKATLTAVPTGFIEIGSPVPWANLGIVSTGEVFATIGGLPTRYRGSVDLLAVPDRFGVVQSSSAGIANTRWAAAAPAVWAIGDFYEWSFVAERS